MREALYGGAAGGGKSDALLMAALRYVHVEGYHAILFRRTYADLIKDGALVPRSKAWFANARKQGKVTWNGSEKRWTFSSGATLAFGYMESDDDRFAYDGTDYQFVGFDEVAQFSMVQYRYLFRSLRKPNHGELAHVPLRMRSSCNPIGRGLEWVRERFQPERPGPFEGRVFVPSRVQDNPGLNVDDYVQSLNELDPVTRAKLLEGSWDAREPGGYFRREWIRISERAPTQAKRLRWWDEASTEENSQNTDPDYTVGLLLAEYDGTLWIEDVVRGRWSPGARDTIMRQTAEVDGRKVLIRSGEEPGSAGKSRTDHLRKRVFNGFQYKGIRETGDKETRAASASSRCEAGDLHIVRAPWNRAFLDEAEAFGLPDCAHDDQVDALSGAYSELCGKPTPKIW